MITLLKKTTFLLLSFLLYYEGVYSQKIETYVPNELIIKFKSRYDMKNKPDGRQFGYRILDSLNRVNDLEKIRITGNKRNRDTYVLKFKKNQDVRYLVKLYLRTNLFEYVEPDYIGSIQGTSGKIIDREETTLNTILPNDTYFSRQYSLYNDGSFTIASPVAGADVKMNWAWTIEQGDSSVIVAIIDAGAKLDHPEFAGRIWTNKNETLDTLDNDANGYVDDIRGWDFVNNDNDPTDDFGHGTAVAGIIGADGNNNTGYAGVDWHCKLMVCKALDQTGYGVYSNFVDAIYYAVHNGAKVINMSLGGSAASTLFQNAITYAHNKGVVVVAAMGNSNVSTPYYPAKYSETIAVGSTDANDDRSTSFSGGTGGSNYGNHIDVVAPGNYIVTLQYNSNTSYNVYYSGTSMSAPLVSGICALLLAKYPALTPDDVRVVLRNSAEDQVGNTAEDTPGFDIYFGYGRVNAYQALMLTGLDNTKMKRSDFRIFPNPVSANLYVSLIGKNEVIKIINAQGAIVFEEKVLDKYGSLKVDVSNFSKGIYVVQLFDENDNYFSSEKVIIQ